MSPGVPMNGKAVFGIFMAAVVTLSAQSTEELMSQGTMLIQNGAFDQAVTCFRKVVARDNRNFEAQFNLAFAYLNAGRNSIAIDEFNKAASINPSSTETWSNMAVAYQNLGKTAEALGALDKAVRLNPGNMQARLNLATMYATQEKYEQAITQYKQILQTDKSQIDAYVNIAKCYITLKKYNDAEVMLKEGLEQNSDEAELHYDLGNLVWDRDKDAKSAAANYRTAIVLDPNNLSYRENLASVLETFDKPAAVASWKECLAYTSDAMKKESVQRKIDALEGRSASGAASINNDPYAGQTMEMKKVEREESKSKSDGQVVKGQKMDVGSDLDDLKSTEGEDRFEIKVPKSSTKK